MTRLTTRVLDRLGALRCGGLRGHAWVLVVYRGGLYLQCACGARTAGFRVGMVKEKA